MIYSRVLSTLAVVGGLGLSTASHGGAQTPIRDLDNPARQPFRKSIDRTEIIAGTAQAAPIIVTASH